MQENVRFAHNHAHTRKVKKPKATWFKPRVLVDVEFRALTGTRKLRHPSYKGVRQNLDPRPVVKTAEDGQHRRHEAYRN
jgi:ATP-dependent DNA ligase